MVEEVEEARHCLLRGEAVVDLRRVQKVSLEEVVVERQLQAVRCARGWCLSALETRAEELLLEVQVVMHLESFLLETVAVLRTCA